MVVGNGGPAAQLSISPAATTATGARAGCGRACQAALINTDQSAGRGGQGAVADEDVRVDDPMHWTDPSTDYASPAGGRSGWMSPSGEPAVR